MTNQNAIWKPGLWHTPVAPVPGSLKQKDHSLESSLDLIHSEKSYWIIT